MALKINPITGKLDLINETSPYSISDTVMDFAAYAVVIPYPKDFKAPVVTCFRLYRVVDENGDDFENDVTYKNLVKTSVSQLSFEIEADEVLAGVILEYEVKEKYKP